MKWLVKYRFDPVLSSSFNLGTNLAAKMHRPPPWCHELAHPPKMASDHAVAPPLPPAQIELAVVSSSSPNVNLPYSTSGVLTFIDVRPSRVTVGSLLAGDDLGHDSLASVACETRRHWRPTEAAQHPIEEARHGDTDGSSRGAVALEVTQ